MRHGCTLLFFFFFFVVVVFFVLFCFLIECSANDASVLLVNEQSRESTVLFVLRKLILQMRSHLVELDVLVLVGPFVYFHTL